MKFLVLLLLVIGLGFAVTRVVDLKNVLPKPKASGIQATDGYYKSAVQPEGTFDDFTVSGNGAVLKDYTARFNNKTCGIKNYEIKNPSPVAITDGKFSFNYKGLAVDGTINSVSGVSVTEKLTDFQFPNCSSLSRGGPFSFAAALVTPTVVPTPISKPTPILKPVPVTTPTPEQGGKVYSGDR